MAQYDAANAEVLIFTFKEGVLSAMAHDLQLRANRFIISEERHALRAEVEVDSVKVMHAMKDGKAAPEALGSFAFAEIEKNISRVVLDARKAPKAIFVADRIEPDAIGGTLTLNGVSRPVQFSLKHAEGRRIASLTFDQRDFRIVPYSAMLGALKVQPNVRVEVRLPGV